MQINNLTSIKGQRKAKRIGRGGKRGTFSGKGVKGQKSRAGRKMRPEWRDVLKRIPKKRGYHFKPVSEKVFVLNLNTLNSKFQGGDLINIKVLVQKGLVQKVNGRIPEVKILGGGEISKKLNFKGIKVSGSAREKIEKAGGQVA